MSVLTVVRHGQASFLEDDYDKLSPLGELQARRLGEYWARTRTGADRVYSGPRERQRRTAALAVEASRAAGLNLPDPIVDPAWDEHFGHEVMTQLLPEILATDVELAAVHSEFERAADFRTKTRAFQRVFEVVMMRWVRGELTTPDIEPWQAFVARVRSGIMTATSGLPNGQRIVVFTSGGPSAVAAQHALNIDEEATMTLSWMVRNSAMNEFLFTSNRMTLSAFNTIPHLDNPDWWTYR